MVAFAELQYLRNTELWKSYTPEWRAFKIQETPEIEWKFWLKSEPYRSLPVLGWGLFCDKHTAGYWKFDSEKNFRTCNECGLLPLSVWPMFVFECDTCEEIFVADRYPIHYELCKDCGG